MMPYIASLISENLAKRCLVLVVSLFLMALGIVLCIRADLGISPISLPPFVLSLGLPLTVGEFTIVMHVLFILGQVFLLKKNFHKVQYLQIAMALIFGYFIDFSMLITQWVQPSNYVMEIATLLMGCTLMAGGVNFELLSDTLLLPSEGLAMAIVHVSGIPYKRIKIVFDVTLLIIGFLCSIFLLHRIEGIREGTIITAFLIGILVGILEPGQRWCAEWLKQSEKISNHN